MNRKAARSAVRLAVGICAWSGWLIFGAWAAFAVHDAFGTLPALVVGIVVMAAAVAVPVYAIETGMID